MKTVNEMADELCRMVAGHGLGEAASTRVSSYRAAATYVLYLIAQAKAPSPEAVVLRGGLLGPMTQEEVEALGWETARLAADSADKLLAHRRANLPRVTVKELTEELDNAMAMCDCNAEQDMSPGSCCFKAGLRAILTRLGRSVVVEHGEAPDPETQGRLDALRRELETERQVSERRREAAEKLSGHVRDLMAAVRVAEGWNEIEDLVGEWGS